ncbi:extracellular solute-binding protein [Paenibacillus doosanensis]|uniref:extracellular solute-binding protein n=1 Tax=Paenibacillus doosanensis TaxID=1229154 RepID=UPI00218085A6|nr:extracellular solute-binding protein [Paenibacillus doosanensis]MCS7464760.1 extracellular solute-binding protein [Paenibacillus doosanensis]
MRGRLNCISAKVMAIALMALFVAMLLGGCKEKDERADGRDSDFKTIGLMIPLHQNQAPPPDMLRAVEQAVQAKLEIDWIPDDNYRDKIINALQTNSLKQVTYVNQSDYVYMKNAIRSGMFWEIGPYLQFYPNLKKLNKSILNETGVEGKIYSLYTERPASRQGVILRKDWLDRLHLQAPRTTDELYEALKRFATDDPDGNGVQDTLGIADRGDLTYGAFKTLGSYFGTPNNWGLQDGALVPDFKTKEYADTMNFMKKLVSEQIVNKDFAVTSKQIQRYMIINGKAGGFIGNLADAPRLLSELRKFEPQAELVLINRIKGPKGEGIWSYPGYSGVFLFSKKAIKNEEELRSILGFFDRSLNKEPANLLQYGIEGKHYELKQGKVSVTEEMKLRYDTDVLPLTSLVVAGMDNENLLEPEDELEAPLVAEVNRLTKDNESMLIRDRTEGLSSPTYDMRGAELSDIIANATFNYILGKIDLAAFYNEVAAWESRGGADIIKEYNEAYKQISNR